MPVEGIRSDLRHLYPDGTSTIQMILDGHRRATTRSYPCGDMGEVITFEGTGIPFLITNRYQLKDMSGGFTWEKWSHLEGWCPDFIRNDQKLREQCNLDAWQTVFVRMKTFDI